MSAQALSIFSDWEHFVAGSQLTRMQKFETSGRKHQSSAKVNTSCNLPKRQGYGRDLPCSSGHVEIGVGFALGRLDGATRKAWTSSMQD